MSRPENFILLPGYGVPCLISLALGVSMVSVLATTPAVAQVTPSGGSRTQVDQNGPHFTITGGALSADGTNLFHTFSQLNLTAEQSANFLANPSIQRVLGQIQGGHPSVIDGLLQVTNSHADLYLLNPSGIFFGPNARLDVPGDFTATTATHIGFGEHWLNVSGENDYAALEGSPQSLAFSLDQIAAIVNQGELDVTSGQSLTLAAGSVINQGTLTAEQGHVAIASLPDSGLIRLSPSGHILSIDLNPLDLPPLTTVLESGIPETSLNAELPALLTGGSLDHAVQLMIAGDGTIQIVGEDGAIAHSGTTTARAIAIQGTEVTNTGVLDASGHMGGDVAIAADTLHHHGNILASGLSGGTIVLDGNTTHITGTVDVTGDGAQGGRIEVLGDHVTLAGAHLDASGTTAGGTVLVGGDYRGRGETRQAASTVVDDSSRLNVSAVDVGNAGTAVIWADGQTDFSGTILARGGTYGGNGGLVEVSGTQTLNLGPNWVTAIDISAPLGSAGTLLFDPNDIFILGGASGGIGSSPTNNNVIFSDDISAFLENNGSLIIETSGTGGNGDVTFSAATVNWTSTNDLTINADRSISLDKSSSITSTLGDITLNANIADIATGFFRGIDVDRATLSSAGGAITLTGIGGNNNSSDENHGVYLRSGSVIQNTTGPITITGTGSNASTGSFDLGIWVENSQISTTTGAIALEGTGGNSQGFNHGLFLSGASQITTQSGEINLLGQGGSGTGASGNEGIGSNGSIIIESTAGSSITLDGTGGTGSGKNIGINVTSPTFAITGAGTSDLALIGHSPTGDSGIQYNGTITSTTGDLRLVTDDLDLPGTVQGQGILMIAPFSVDTDISLGAGNIPDALVFGTGDFQTNIVDGFTNIRIGRTDGTGAIALGSTITFNDPVTIVGGSALDVSGFPDTTWTITGADRGNLNTRFPNGFTFEQIEHLEGSFYSDIFAFADGASFAGTISGGNGPHADTLDYSASTSNVTVNVGNLTDIESVMGSTIAPTSTIQGANIANTWDITGTNEGTINGITFQEFNALRGGTAADTWNLDNGITFAGTIDGDKGSQTFTANSTLDLRSVGDITALGDLSLQASGDILANTLTASGQNLSIVSNAGSITTGDLSTVGINGGAIALQAQAGEVRTGAIATHAIDGEGGTVTINADSSVVTSINTTGTQGGNVTSTVNQYFQITGVDAATGHSIDTSGATQNGNLTIHHGELNFGVGTVQSSGSNTTLTSGAATLVAPQTITGNFADANLTIHTTISIPSTPTPIPFIAPTPSITPTPTPVPSIPPTPTPIPSTTPPSVATPSLTPTTSTPAPVPPVSTPNPGPVSPQPAESPSPSPPRPSPSLPDLSKFEAETNVVEQPLTLQTISSIPHTSEIAQAPSTLAVHVEVSLGDVERSLNQEFIDHLGLPSSTLSRLPNFAAASSSTPNASATATTPVISATPSEFTDSTATTPDNPTGNGISRTSLSSSLSSSRSTPSSTTSFSGASPAPNDEARTNSGAGTTPNGSSVSSSSFSMNGNAIAESTSSPVGRETLNGTNGSYVNGAEDGSDTIAGSGNQSVSEAISSLTENTPEAGSPETITTGTAPNTPTTAPTLPDTGNSTPNSATHHSGLDAVNSSGSGANTDQSASGVEGNHASSEADIGTSTPSVPAQALTSTATTGNDDSDSQSDDETNLQDPTLVNAQRQLKAIAQTSGIQPALIYAIFVGEDGGSGVANRVEGGDRSGEDPLSLMLVTAEGEPISLMLPDITRANVLAIADEMRAQIGLGARRANSQRYLGASQQLYDWIIAPLDAELQARGVDNIAFITEPGLRSIPFAALHDRTSFLIERYSVGMMPSLSLTNTQYNDLRHSDVLAMGVSDFAEDTQLTALPAVPAEVGNIAGEWWDGAPLLNESSTLANLSAARTTTPYGIVHLATHADFQPGALSNSYIQLWDEKLRLDQLRDLNWHAPPVSLVILSACRTALGNEEAELGFAGLAVQAGANSAIASLWSVSDEGTLGLMSELYLQLQKVPTKAEALRQTQLSLIEGQLRVENGTIQGVREGETLELPPALSDVQARNLSHPFFWASFTLVGSPW